MKLDTLSDLKKLIALCRAQGVTAIKLDSVELTLGEAPQRIVKIKETAKHYPTIAPGGITDDTRISTEELTEEQLLFYSATDQTQEHQQ